MARRQIGRSDINSFIFNLLLRLELSRQPSEGTNVQNISTSCPEFYSLALSQYLMKMPGRLKRPTKHEI